MTGVCLCFLLCLPLIHRVQSECSIMWEEQQKEHHPCFRTCVKDKPMVCMYNFNVEMYYSMSKACYDCPANISDCYRKDCVHGDGYGKSLYTVNRQIPGPIIEVCQGDKIVVVLENTMNDETTSIHWHGMLQHGTPYMDGVPMITQCPISPGSTFTYTFWANDSGTHFWHGHTGMQRVDGLFGPLIVRQPDSELLQRELYDVDKHVIVLNDWSHTPGIEKIMSYLHRGGTNAPHTILCNGKGRYYNDTIQVTYTPLEVFHVEEGKRYRIRVINSGSFDCPVAISVDNHTVTAVASDGSEFKPVEVDSLVIYAGERFDFILHANKSIGNYWIRFIGLMNCKGAKSHTVAILHYKGADCTEPSAAIGYSIHPIPEMELNSLNVARNASGTINIPQLSAPYNRTKDDSTVLKETPDVQIVLAYDFNSVNNPAYHKDSLYGVDQVNSSMHLYTPQLEFISFKMPNAPPLSQPCDLDPKILCNNQNLEKCKTEYCECTKIYEVELDSVVELIIIDKGVTYNANHPFHLHGNAFRVVAMDRCGEETSVEFVKMLDEEGYIQRNLIDAPYKDTVTVPDGGYTILRFLAKNAGMWLFHCHLDFHVELKMAVLFKIGQIKDFPPVPHNFRECGVSHGRNARRPCTLAHPHLYTTNITSTSTI